MVGRVLPTAICVRGVNDRCVLQFTLILASGCALHRRTSLVIHRIDFFFFSVSLSGFERRQRATFPAVSRADSPKRKVCASASSAAPRLRERTRHRWGCSKKPRLEGCVSTKTTTERLRPARLTVRRPLHRSLPFGAGTTTGAVLALIGRRARCSLVRTLS